jgi:hypothetical protein
MEELHMEEMSTALVSTLIDGVNMLKNLLSPSAIVITVALGSGHLLAGPAQDQAGGTVSFTIEGEKYSMALPDGFCLPTDPKLQTAASRMAQGDSANITHFTAVPCTEVFQTDGVLSAWIVLKTPRGSLRMRIPTRAAMLAEYKKGFDGELQRLLDQPDISDSTERLKQAFGAAVRLNKFDMRPVDLDDNAAYMG